MSPEPEPVAELDRRLLASIRGFHRARWAGVAALVVVVLTAIGLFAWIATAQESELAASCQFFRDLATVPLPSKPTPSRFGVALVVSSRTAYTGQGCGSLPPPSPALLHLADRYHIKVTR